MGMVVMGETFWITPRRCTLGNLSPTIYMKMNVCFPFIHVQTDEPIELKLNLVIAHTTACTPVIFQLLARSGLGVKTKRVSW